MDLVACGPSAKPCSKPAPNRPIRAISRWVDGAGEVVNGGADEEADVGG